MFIPKAIEIDPWYLNNLICPLDGTPLRYTDRYLVSPAGKAYPVVDGVPVMMIEGAAQTFWVAEASRRIACEAATTGRIDDPYFIDAIGVSPEEIRQLRELIHRNTTPVDPVVSILVGATNGNMYKDLIGRLEAYPIPKLPLPSGEGKTFLDVGCNWGRWCIAAAKQGYRGSIPKKWSGYRLVGRLVSVGDSSSSVSPDSRRA